MEDEKDRKYSGNSTMKVKVNQVTRYHFLFIPSSWWSRSLLKILKITTHTSTLSLSTVNYRLERIESEDVTDSRKQFLFITWNLSHRAPFAVHVRDIWSKMIFKKKVSRNFASFTKRHKDYFHRTHATWRFPLPHFHRNLTNWFM